MRETRGEAHGGEERRRRDEVAERTWRLCEEDKGTQGVKYSLRKSNDRTLNYSKESRLLCMMSDAAQQQQCCYAVRCCLLL